MAALPKATVSSSLNSPPVTSRLSWLQQWKYKVLGPTTIHLQHEIYLLFSLLLLMVGSFQSLYKSTFGSTDGDIKFCLLAFLWLSRHVLVRLICTWDNHSSDRRPNVRGLLAHWLTSNIMSGQYFDRPSHSMLAKYNLVGAPRVGDEEVRASAHSSFISSLLYAKKLVTIRIWFPLLRFHDWIGVTKRRASSSISVDSSTTSGSGNTNSNSQYYHPSGSRGGGGGRQRNNYPYISPFFTKFVGAYLNFPIISAIIVIYYAWTLPALIMPSKYRLEANMQDSSPATLTAYGAYEYFEKPQWSDVFFYLSIPTVASLLVYR